MPARMMMLSAAMRYRKVSDTLVPMIPVIPPARAIASG